MKKLILSIAIFITAFNLSAHVDDYKELNYLEYELFRNNKLIGEHKYYFTKKNDILTVKSVVNFKITKLGVDLYKYFAESEESYKNGKFYEFSSTTKQNKKDKYVNIKSSEDENKLIINGSSYKGDASNEFIVGTWWNHEIVQAKAQISAISGRIIPQSVKFIGEEELNINGKIFNALHLNFSSSQKNLPKEKILNTDIWYDKKTNLWIKASFDKTGFWEYRLKIYK